MIWRREIYCQSTEILSSLTMILQQWYIKKNHCCVTVKLIFLHMWWPVLSVSQLAKWGRGRLPPALESSFAQPAGAGLAHQCLPWDRPVQILPTLLLSHPLVAYLGNKMQIMVKFDHCYLNSRMLFPVFSADSYVWLCLQAMLSWLISVCLKLRCCPLC